MNVAARFVMLAVVLVAAGQEIRFQTATVVRNESGALSGGSQILPDGKVILTNTSVRDLLRIVYDVPDFAIVGAPDWFASDRYDVNAQAAGKPTRDELKQMMRALLAEQFQFVSHREASVLPVYELRRVALDGSLGPNLRQSKTSCESGGAAACPHELNGNSYTAVAMPIARIVRTLAELSGRPVIDKSNLSGLFDVTLSWTGGTAGVLAAVREQWGLELQARDEATQVLVVDRAARPVAR